MLGLSLTFLWRLLGDDVLAQGQSDISSSSLHCECTALILSLTYWGAH